VAGDINRVMLIGRLTRDPELRQLPSGFSVLQFGLANNGRQKDESGNWTDRPNFFDVKVFGNQAESLVNHLSKGRRIGIDGRLEWSSWEAQDGTKRSKVEIVAQTVQFLDSRNDGDGPGYGQSQGGGQNEFVRSAAPAANADFPPSGADDDIPF
jgi:single-strand DNA-binding protein